MPSLARIPGAHIRSYGGVIQLQTSNYRDDVYLEVGRWELKRIFEEAPLECSGLLGAPSSRRVSYRNTFAFETVFDKRWPPDYIFRPIDGVNCYFMYGNPDDYMEGSTGSSDFEYTPRYYWVPIACLDSASPILDANGKKMVRQVVQGHSRGHVYLTPDEGDPFKSGTKAGAYAKYIGAVK